MKIIINISVCEAKGSSHGIWYDICGGGKEENISNWNSRTSWGATLPCLVQLKCQSSAGSHAPLWGMQH